MISINDCGVINYPIVVFHCDNVMLWLFNSVLFFKWQLP
jgi:hypothetical protein